MSTTMYNDEPLHMMIKARRLELGWSVAGLAMMVGVSQGTMYNYESGAHLPNRETLATLEESLGVLAGTLVNKLEAMLPIEQRQGYNWVEESTCTICRQQLTLEYDDGGHHSEVVSGAVFCAKFCEGDEACSQPTDPQRQKQRDDWAREKQAEYARRYQEKGRRTRKRYWEV